MIKLACNYYPEVIELIKDKKIDINYVKFPALGYQMSVFEKGNLSDFETLATEVNKVCPIMMHGLGPTPHNIGSKSFIQDLNVEIAKKIIKLSGVNGISLHLVGGDTSLSRSETKDIFIKNITYLKMLFPDVEFISFENVDGNPFMQNNDFGFCIEPEFISEIIEETNTDFLLDISHAYCSAKAISMDFDEYLSKLPLHRIYEIHINGWIETQKDIMAHTKINDLGYQTLQNILMDNNPKIVTLEYGRSNDRLNCGIPLMEPNNINEFAKIEIIEQIKRLEEIISRFGK